MSRKVSETIVCKVYLGIADMDLKIEDGKLLLCTLTNLSGNADSYPDAEQLFKAGEDLQRAARDMGYRAQRQRHSDGPSVDQMREDLKDAAEKGLWTPRAPLTFQGTMGEYIDLFPDGATVRKWKEVCGG